MQRIGMGDRISRYAVRPAAIRRPDGAERSALSHGWRQTTGCVTYIRLYGIALEIHRPSIKLHS